MGLLNWFKSLLFGPPKAQPGVTPFPPDMGPARLIVLRHAEKTGDKRDRNLSPAGHERAARLVPYVLETFGRPDFLIAAKSSGRSRRPVETIEPLATALGLEIKSKFDDDEVDDLVEVTGRETSLSRQVRCRQLAPFGYSTSRRRARRARWHLARRLE